MLHAESTAPICRDIDVENLQSRSGRTSPVPCACACSNLVFELWERPAGNSGSPPQHLVRVLYQGEVLHFPGTDQGERCLCFRAAMSAASSSRQ